MMRQIPDFLPEFIRGAEGLWLTGQHDQVGRPTWGYGHTGPDVVIGGTITLEQAESLLYADLVKAATKLATAVKLAVLAGLAEHQYAALVSFVFNLGCDPKWKLWALLNAGHPECVPPQMMRFDHEHLDDGRVVEVAGLFNRRAAEVTLWKTADLGAAIAVAKAAPIAPPPSSVTTTVKTPPSPMAPKPPLTSKSIMSAGGASLLAVVTPFLDQIKSWGGQLNDAITPYAGSSTILQHLQGELMTALAVVAVASLVFSILKNREAT